MGIVNAAKRFWSALTEDRSPQETEYNFGPDKGYETTINGETSVVETELSGTEPPEVSDYVNDALIEIAEVYGGEDPTEEGLGIEVLKGGRLRLYGEDTGTPYRAMYTLLEEIPERWDLQTLPKENKLRFGSHRDFRSIDLVFKHDA